MITVIDDSFTLEQKSIIESNLKSALDSFKVNDKMIKLEINNSNRLKTTAGMATIKRSKKLGIISLNKKLFNTTAGIKEFENTFTHELAHIIANFLTGRQCGHDSYWKSIHKKLGGNGKRCHDYEVEHLKPKIKRHRYTCRCIKDHNISTRKHNKILKGAKYRCVKCYDEIKKAIEL